MRQHQPPLLPAGPVRFHRDHIVNLAPVRLKQARSNRRAVKRQPRGQHLAQRKPHLVPAQTQHRAVAELRPRARRFARPRALRIRQRFRNREGLLRGLLQHTRGHASAAFLLARGRPDRHRPHRREHPLHNPRDLPKLLLRHAALSQPRQAEAQGARVRAVRIARDHVLVAHYAGNLQQPRSDLAVQERLALYREPLHVHQEHVRVRPAILQNESFVRQTLREELRVLRGFPLERTERLVILQNQLEQPPDRSDAVHVRPALHAREHRGIHLSGQFRIGRDDHRAARPAKRLVRGESDDVRVRQRIAQHAAGNQSGQMRHVGQQQAVHLVGDRTQRGPVEIPRVRRGPADDQPRPARARLLANPLVIEPPRVRINAVGMHLVRLA